MGLLPSANVPCASCPVLRTDCSKLRLPARPAVRQQRNSGRAPRRGRRGCHKAVLLLAVPRQDHAQACVDSQVLRQRRPVLAQLAALVVVLGVLLVVRGQATERAPILPLPRGVPPCAADFLSSFYQPIVGRQVQETTPPRASAPTFAQTLENTVLFCVFDGGKGAKSGNLLNSEAILIPISARFWAWFSRLSKTLCF